MEILNRNGQLATIKLDLAPPKGPNSERSYYVSLIEKLTGCPRKALLFKHLKHIPGGSEGLKLIKYLWSVAETGDTADRKRILFWQELKKTKI